MTEVSSIYGIVLAAGRSQRMGQDKAALPWLNDQTLGQWLLETLATTGWSPRIVLAPHNWQWGQQNLPEEYLVLNADPGQGKTSSIAAGVKAVPQQAKAILISAIDQPRQPELYTRLKMAGTTHGDRILIPTLNGRWDHPPVFSGAWRNHLLNLDDHQGGLRHLLNQFRDNVYSLPGKSEWGLGWDVNTPKTYNQALQLFKNRG